LSAIPACAPIIIVLPCGACIIAVPTVPLKTAMLPLPKL
jgi:hypothetical protein